MLFGFRSPESFQHGPYGTGNEKSLCGVRLQTGANSLRGDGVWPLQPHAEERRNRQKSAEQHNSGQPSSSQREKMHMPVPDMIVTLPSVTQHSLASPSVRIRERLADISLSARIHSPRVSTSFLPRPAKALVCLYECHLVRTRGRLIKYKKKKYYMRM